ncbi:hypothetical protein E0485_21340 [Paenibacillus albiflavus]|uniref:Uncharacterized protein n=1 Tax=Paenibacillus albiflavus TaxID=2545760 RepID=A0A4V2WMW9_9BACL|nr:hypothetical protein [Paenibacillus albiflavus]TCZ73242.1 hypothetical protein E0485_21340 [Paenibacillus albiflavus]
MISNKIIKGKSISKSKLSYKDSKYGFSLQLPRWWKRFIIVKRKKQLIDAEYGVFFIFKYKGKVYEEVLSLLVFRMTRKQWRNKGYDDSPIIFLAERNGLIYAYTVPEELPEDFLNKSKQDYDYRRYGRPIRLLKRMVNEDVPRIVRTLGLE